MNTKTFLGAGTVALVVAAIFLYGGAPAASLCRECNVIIIGVDTLRADHIRAFGYGRDTTPTLDALAQKGYVFTNAISPASWTVPTFMSLFTGLYPSVHKVTNKFFEFDPVDKSRQILSNLQKLSPGTKTLAEVMQGAGYATGGFTGDAGVSAKFGYDRGFDVYTDEKAFGGLDNSASHALGWLDSLPEGRKFFMFFHGYDLHGQFVAEGESRYAPQDYMGPYTGSPKEEEVLREAILTPEGIQLTPADVDFWTALYDGKIRQADARLGEFLDELRIRGLLEHTILIIVSDHGEEFYEHGQFDHGQSLYDELIRVPLIIALPGQAGGSVISAQVSTIDLMPTVFDIVGVRSDLNTQLTGRNSLVPYFGNPNKEGYDVFSETDYRDFTHKRSIRTADGWKYILTLESGKEELYDLQSDPQEFESVLLSEPAKAEELRLALRAHMQNELGADLSLSVDTGCLPVYEGECLQP